MKTQNTMILNCMKFGVFLGLFSETYLNTTLPQLMLVFGVSANSVQWLTAGYMLVMAMFVPISAFIIKRTTTKQLFTLAMSVFLVGTIIASGAPSFSFLLAGRLVQAIGTSVLLPLLMHTIMVLYPPKERGAAMGTAMLVVLFAPAIGPTFGGFVLEALSWRWIFLLIIPLSIASLAWGVISLKNVMEPEEIQLDILSVILSIFGFGCVVYGLQSLFSHAQFNLLGLVILTVGLLFLLVFGFRQLRLTTPMLDIRIFKNKTYSKGVLMIMITHMVMFSNFILMPMFLVNILELSVLHAGLVVLPGGILGAILPVVAGKIYDRRGPRAIVAVGFACITLANFLITLVSPTTIVFVTLVLYAMVISGVAVILTPTQTNTLNQLQLAQVPHGTAALNTMMLLGASMGASFFVAIMSARTHALAQQSMLPQQALLGGITCAYRFVALLAGVGCLLSLSVRQKKKGVNISSRQ